MSQFKVGDIVEYHAVDPEYGYLNGHTGIVESILVNSVGIPEYTIAWLTSMGAEVARKQRRPRLNGDIAQQQPVRVSKGWREAVLRKVAQLSPSEAGDVV